MRSARRGAKDGDLHPLGQAHGAAVAVPRGGFFVSQSINREVANDVFASRALISFSGRRSGAAILSAPGDV